MIPVILGLGGLIAKVTAAAVIPRIVKALSALGGATETIRANPTKPIPEPVSEIARPSEKVLYGRSLPTRNKKQYFGQGVIANGIKLFYTRDQLGSVRELIDAAGVVRADYRYSPYGERTKESGDLDSDWGYAGLWHHGPSGLDLATFRTYDSAQGRWISRDPLGEGVDYNLYRYCNNNPISCVDPMGLQTPGTMTPGGLVVQGLGQIGVGIVDIGLGAGTPPADVVGGANILQGTLKVGAGVVLWWLTKDIIPVPPEKDPLGQDWRKPLPVPSPQPTPPVDTCPPKDPKDPCKSIKDDLDRLRNGPQDPFVRAQIKLKVIELNECRRKHGGEEMMI